MIIRCKKCNAILGNLKNDGVYVAMNNTDDLNFTGKCIGRRNEVEVLCKCGSITSFYK